MFSAAINVPPRPTTARADSAASGSTARVFVLDDVGWDTYELLVRDLAGQHVQITYDAGRVVLMSPLPIHELLKGLIGRLIETAALAYGIPVQPLGSTTWKREDLARGLEADECYYVQNEARIRGLTQFDLTRDPPPDLAIEIDTTHRPIDRASVYAKLGVNEIWRHDGQQIEFLKLAPDGRYLPIAQSDAFPFLTPDVINEYVSLLGKVSHTEIASRFTNWLTESRRP